MTDRVAQSGIGEGLAIKLRRLWLQRGGFAAKADKQMRVVETLSLGGRRQVHLVVCGDQRFLVGCGSDSVECIVSAALAAVPATQDQQ